MAAHNGPGHLSPEEFRQLGHQTVDWLAGYMRRLEGLPVAPSIRPGDILRMLPEHPPEQGFAAGDALREWGAVFEDLDRVIVPGLLNWQSPRFFGYFPCNSSGPGILGEMLSGGLNVIGMMWATSPAATELEMRVMDWLAGMLDLPAVFRSGGAGGGCIQGTASESTLIAMLAARERALDSGAKADELVAYTSTQAHSSVVKAAMVAGFARGPDDRSHLRLIDVDDQYRMRPDLLARAIAEDRAGGRTPFYVCATVGTTSTTSVDPVAHIASVLGDAGGRRVWLHVDAAHAGAACICPEFRWMLAGVEQADSLCFNPHKWLLTNFDCDCFWVRDCAALVRALSITPEYLRNPASESGEVIDYRDWQIPLGRRFRALKLWLVIRHYGAAGLRMHIREHVRLAGLLEEWVRADERFELAAPRTLNLVCFRLRGGDGDGRTRRLLERLNAGGRAFMTHTILRDASGADRFVVRMAIGSTLTEERHVREAWEAIGALAGE
jgi:aromatic-L-amino-acid/L-tryptophan decarboxylase